MTLQSCTSNLKLDTGAAASQSQASKKPLRNLVGEEQHPPDKPMSISTPSEKAPASPAAAQVAPTASLFTDLSPSSSPHHTAVPPSPRIVLQNQRLSQGIALPQPPKDCPKAQAMRSAQLIQMPRAPLAKAEAVGAGPAQHLTASGGKEVALYQREGQWQAQVTERIGHAQRQVVLPVVCAPDCEVAALLGYEAGRVAQLLHVAKQGLAEFVYVGRQGLLGGMIPGEEGFEEKKESGSPQGAEEHKEAFPQEQSTPRGSLLKLGLSEHQGPTAVEQAQREIARLKEAIEEGHGLLLSLGTANSQVIEKLFSDLEQWLQEEQLCRPAAGDEGAQEYIIRLREDPRLTWGDHRAKLSALLAQAYGQALQQVVAADRIHSLPDRVAQLSAALTQLARFHQEQGEQTGDLSHYTDAAILYQHVRTLCAGEESGYEAQIAGAYQGLAQIKTAMLAKVKQAQEQALLSSEITPEALQEEIARDREELAVLRAEARERLATLAIAEQNDEALYTQESKALFGHIAEQVGALLGRLYQESENALGLAPCRYTVMGLGSMALQQMTPYSDLEFAILMEDNEDPAILDKHRAYFRELSHLVHLRVINLGETVVPRSKYGVSVDYLGKRGINFDLGGKTPLGRSDKLYDLIQPVAGMMRYLRNEGHKMEHMDKLLPFILERTCYVHGDQGLHEAYEQASKKFLQEGQTEQGVPVYQARALQKLLEGVVEMDYSQAGPGIAKPGQPGDLADFAPKVGYEYEGRLYDVKQEIYRLPDRLLCRLAMYYGLLPESGWDAVEQLRSKGIISAVAAGHLGYAVSFATLLRLKTYLHHGQQKEEMGVLSGVRKEPMQQIVSQSFALPAAALEAGGSLFKYYYTALPLHESMQKFFNTNEKGEGFFESQAFYNDNDRVKGKICIRLMQHEAVIGCYKKIIEILKAVDGAQDQLGLARSLSNVGLAYAALGDVQKALEYQEQALEMFKELYGGKVHSDLASSLNNVGSAYAELGNARKGLEYQEQVLEMFKELYGVQADSTLGVPLMNVGTAYEELGEVRKGLKYKEQALEIFKKLYGEKSHPTLARSLNNVGSTYAALGDEKQGLAYKEQALEMFKELYGEQAHPDVAMSLNNVGCAYAALGDEKQGLAYKEQALETYKEFYGERAHSNIASSLNNVGSTYAALGDEKQALMYYEQALEMRQALYENKAHPDIAMSLNNVGIAYKALGDARKRLKYQEQALEMFKELYGEQAHPKLASSLNNVGRAYEALGDARKGLTYQEQALEMFKAVYRDKVHPDIAMSLNNVGCAYVALGDARKGLQYKEQALEMFKELYGEQAHPDVAMSLNNVGCAYEALGDARKGLTYQEQALEMFKELYGEQAHPDIAMSLNNVGCAYVALGDARKGLQYKEQALAMRQALYREQAHPDIAMSLNNVGSAYEELGDARKGLQYKEQALAMRQALYGNKAHPDIASSLNNVGLAYAVLGDARKRLKYQEQALEMFKELYGEQAHPDIAMSLNNVGLAYAVLGNACKGLQYKEQALAMRQALYGNKAHPDIASSLNNVGLAYEELGDARKGLTYQEQAFEMFKAVYGDKVHPKLASSLNNVGSAYQRLGEAKKGLGYSEQALEMRQALYPGNHPDVANSLNNVGMAYETLEEASKGLGYSEQALEMRQALYPGNHPDVADSLNNVGGAYLTLGEASKGLEYQEQALEMRQALYPGNHPDVANSLNNVGGAYLTLGEVQKGLPYQEQALEMRQALYPGNHPHVANSLNNVGSAYHTLGEAKKGLGYFQQALEMRQALYPGNHPDVADSLNNVGIAYEELGDICKGLHYQEQALQMNKVLSGKRAYPDVKCQVM